MARLHELFRYCTQNKGSDLHMVAGLEPSTVEKGTP